MNMNAINYELGRQMYLFCEHSIHYEVGDSIVNIIDALEEKIDVEIMIQGIVDIWNVYENKPITNEDIIEILEEFSLKHE